MISAQFRDRLITGSVSLLLVSLLIFFSYTDFFKPVFVLFLAAIIAGALQEYYALAEQKGFAPFSMGAISCSVFYIFFLGLSVYYPALTDLLPFAVLSFALLIFLYYFNRGFSPLVNVAITFFGIVYLTIPLSYSLKINYFFPPESPEDGRLWLAYILAVSKMTDIAAYFTGKWCGQHKLAPKISPKKTIEGAIGGLIGAVALSMLFSFCFSFYKESTGFHLSFLESLVLGFVISILAQLGDLTESLLKRDAGVKDSSHLPGLGGILDSVDSLVFTLPFMYLLLQMFK